MDGDDVQEVRVHPQCRADAVERRLRIEPAGERLWKRRAGAWNEYGDEGAANTFDPCVSRQSL